MFTKLIVPRHFLESIYCNHFGRNGKYNSHRVPSPFEWLVPRQEGGSKEEVWKALLPWTLHMPIGVHWSYPEGPQLEPLSPPGIRLKHQRRN